MCKMLDASCNAAGVVSVGAAVVPEAEILSEGNQNSTGIVLIDKENAKYFTSSATDIKTTIEKTEAALAKIALILTAIGAGMTGPTTAPPPTLAADVLALNAIKTELTLLKGALK